MELKQVMLVRVLPSQIASTWGKIKNSVLGALPPIANGEAHARESDILAALTSGRLQMWAICDKDAKHISGVVTTKLVADDITSKMSLLIYTMFGVATMSHGEFVSGLTELKAFALENSCTSIIAYTSNDAVAQLAKSLGADISWRLIDFKLEDK